MDEDFFAASLFDMSTVDVEAHTGFIEGDAGIDAYPENFTIPFPKLVMSGNSMMVVDDYIQISESTEELKSTGRSIFEKDKLNTPGKLIFIKGCGRTRENPHDFHTMPSLRLPAQEKEYSEPIRDRDKNWTIDSQREAINKTPRSLTMLPLVCLASYYSHVVNPLYVG